MLIEGGPITQTELDRALPPDTRIWKPKEPGWFRDNWMHPVVEPGPVEQILVLAKSLIEHGWTQGLYSRYSTLGYDSYGHAVGHYSFCMLGALETAQGKLSSRRTGGHRTRAEHVLQKATPGFSIISYNDQPGRTKEQVLRCFDRAIKMARKQNI